MVDQIEVKCGTLKYSQPVDEIEPHQYCGDKCNDNCRFVRNEFEDMIHEKERVQGIGCDIDVVPGARDVVATFVLDLFDFDINKVACSTECE